MPFLVRCQKVFQNTNLRLLRFSSFALLIAVGMGLTGCSYFFGSKARPPALEFKQSSQQCLTELKANMKSWANTGLPAMDEQIDCIVGGIDQFSKQTAGRSGDGWTKAELAGFFDRYFPGKDGESSSNWIEQILKLKQAWFGGHEERVTRAELSRLREFLLTVKPELAAVSRYAPSLFLKEASGVDAEFVAQRLKRVGEIVLDEIGTTANLASKPTASYSVESILDLLTALRILQPGNEMVEGRRAALSEGVKDLAVGGSARWVTPEEWPRLIPALTSAWGLAIRLKYQMLAADAVSEESLTAFTTEAIDLLRSVAVSQGDEGLRYKKIEDLIETYATDSEGNVGRIEIAKSKIRPSTLQGLMPILFEKILADRSSLPLVAETGGKRIRLEQINVLARIVDNWLAGHHAISEAYGDRDSLSSPIILKNLQIPSANETASQTSAREQLHSLLSQGRIPIRDESSRPMIMPAPRQPEMSKAAALHYNFARVVVTALFRAYGTDRNHLDRLKAAAIEKIYWDIREVGIDFNMIDVRNKGAGPRTFLEASIFTSVSKGDDTVSIGEVVEWYHLALGASNVGDKIYSQLEAVCSTGEPDVYGRTKIRVECLRRNFWDSLATNFPNLPGLVAYYQSASPNVQAEFRQSVEDAGRPLGSASDRSVDSSEVRSIVPILHYTESLMTNHDLNGDGILDSDEVWKAYPTFRGLIGQMAGDSQSELLKKTVFSYLLTFGAPPNAGFFGNMGVVAWMVGKTLWSESADRLKVLRIIASFNIVGRQKKQAALEKLVAESDWRLTEMLEAPESSAPVVALAEAFGCRAEFYPRLAEGFRREALAVKKRVGANQAKFISEMKNVILQNPDFDLRCESF